MERVGEACGAVAEQNLLTSGTTRAHLPLQPGPQLCPQHSQGHIHWCFSVYAPCHPFLYWFQDNIVFSSPISDILEWITYSSNIPVWLSVLTLRGFGLYFVSFKLFCCVGPAKQSQHLCGPPGTLQDEKPNRRPALSAKRSVLWLLRKEFGFVLFSCPAFSRSHRHLITREPGLFLWAVIYSPATF